MPNEENQKSNKKRKTEKDKKEISVERDKEVKCIVNERDRVSEREKS